MILGPRAWRGAAWGVLSGAALVVAVHVHLLLGTPPPQPLAILPFVWTFVVGLLTAGVLLLLLLLSRLVPVLPMGRAERGGRRGPGTEPVRGTRQGRDPARDRGHDPRRLAHRGGRRESLATSESAAGRPRVEGAGGAGLAAGLGPPCDGRRLARLGGTPGAPASGSRVGAGRRRPGATAGPGSLADGALRGGRARLRPGHRPTLAGARRASRAARSLGRRHGLSRWVGRRAWAGSERATGGSTRAACPCRGGCTTRRDRGRFPSF